jgi:hypothetical protein
MDLFREDLCRLDNKTLNLPTKTAQPSSLRGNEKREEKKLYRSNIARYSSIKN